MQEREKVSKEGRERKGYCDMSGNSWYREDIEFGMKKTTIVAEPKLK